ncbi:hypothetical protein E2C01_027690 [Portunus trituberculatus]|uniref:Uncharacterized protein n=1 Tax=Portunus trituberculatus TaxID=210409 RepID=A0A5B7EM80_PORTR|nr:hypothetical protein [Portunus trituberculatus]
MWTDWYESCFLPLILDLKPLEAPEAVTLCFFLLIFMVVRRGEALKRKTDNCEDLKCRPEQTASSTRDHLTTR